MSPAGESAGNTYDHGLSHDASVGQKDVGNEVRGMCRRLAVLV